MKFHFFLLLLVAAIASCSGNKQDTLIEAESFEANGWTKDWQFIEQMGSPYLNDGIIKFPWEM